MIALGLWLAGCTRPCASQTTWRDADGDGWGDPNTTADACGERQDAVDRAGDCDDADPSRHPEAPERCDGVDEDCDGNVDDDPVPTRYVDADDDGFGDPTRPLPGCDAWGVEDATDCDDADPLVNPSTSWYEDLDGDGFGAVLLGEGCERVAPGAVRVGGDCDDVDPERYPSAPERCDGVDQDCVEEPESTQTWAVADASVRVPLTVRATAGGTLPMAVDVDLVSLLAPLGLEPDPTTAVRVFVQDCGGPLGERELPSQWSDGVRGVFEAGPGTDPWDDGAGAVVALWDLDGVAATVEPWPSGPVALALYVGGASAPAPFVSDVEVSADRLAAGGLVARFDADAGGLLDTLRLDGGPVVASQADAAKGNGVATPSGPLSAQDVAGSLVVLDDGPVTAAVVGSAQLENPSGALDVTSTWRVFAGRPELLLRARHVARDGVAIRGTEDRTEAMRPFQALGPSGGDCVGDPGLAWADVSTATDGFTWSWAVPPAWVNFLGCQGAETWSSGNDLAEGAPGQGATGHVPAGTPIADGPLLVLLPHGPGGPDVVEVAREAWRTLPEVDVGAPAWRTPW